MTIFLAVKDSLSEIKTRGVRIVSLKEILKFLGKLAGLLKLCISQGSEEEQFSVSGG